MAHSIGLCARPILPTIDREFEVLTVLVDRDWLKADVHSCQVIMTFLSEFTRECLIVFGTATASASADDIATAWTLAHEQAYPQGPKWPRLLALRTRPDSAEVWRLSAGTAAKSWKFVRGVIEPVQLAPVRNETR